MSAFVKNCTGLRKHSPSPEVEDEDDSSSSRGESSGFRGRNRGRNSNRRRNNSHHEDDIEQSLRRKPVVTPEDVMKLNRVCRGRHDIPLVVYLVV